MKYLLSFSFHCLWCASLFAQGPIDLKLEALSGQSTSEINPGSAFWQILQADFNDNDQIAFSATLALPGPDGPTELWGIFLRDGTAVRKVLLEGDRLPGGTEFVVPGSFGSKRGPAFDLNNKGAVAIVDSQRGVFLYQSGSLEWLARSGALAPGLAASLSDFAASDRFLNERNQIVFRAKAHFFSRSSYGVFLSTGGIILQAAVEGDLVPDRPGRRFELASLERSLPSIVADSTVFKSGANSEGLFAFSVMGLRTVAFAGDEVAGVKGKLASIRHFDMNVRGEIAFVAQMKAGEESSFHVLLRSASGVRRVIGQGSPLPGFPSTGATFFSNLSLNNQGELFFAAELRFTKTGFFLWNDDNILKIVLDDEQTPLGGAYRLAVLTGGGFHFPTPLEFRFALTRINDSREFAFLADVVNEGSRTGVLFRWRAGLIEPLDFRGLAPDAGDRIVKSLFPLALNQSGTLLLKASLCCDSLTSALYTGKPSAPLTQYLPLVAAGEVAGVEFSTSVELANHSVFPGFVSLELQHGSGAAFSRFFPRELVVEAGRITSLGLTGGELAVGFLKMTVNGGGDVTMNARLRVSKQGQLLSQTELTAVSPRSQASLIAQRSSSATTAVALSNPGQDSIFVTVKLRGGLLAEKLLKVNGGGQAAFLIDDLLPRAPAEFAGVLEVSSTGPVLMGGLRIAGLQFSSIPIESDARASLREWGFVNIAPYDLFQLADSFSEARVNSQGHVVALTRDPEGKVPAGQIKLFRNHGVETVAAVGMAVPGTNRKIRASYRGLPILAFNDRDEIVFGADLDGPNIVQAVFLWSNGKLRKIVANGETLPDGTPVFLQFFDRQVAEFTEKGTIVILGTSGLFLYDGTLTRVFRNIELVPGEQELVFSHPEAADLADDGRLFFSTFSVLGFYDGKRITVVAKRGQRLPGSRLIFDRFTSLRVGKNLVFFTAGLSDPGDPVRPFRWGLFSFDGKTFRTVLFDRDGVPTRPGAVFAPFRGAETAFLQLRPEVFQVNKSDVAILLIPTEEAAPSNSKAAGRVLVKIESGFRLQVLFSDDMSLPGQPLEQLFLRSFHWNDLNQLFVLAFLRGLRTGDALLLWRDGKVERILSPGDRLSSPGSSPELVFALPKSWDLAESGALLLEAAVSQGMSGLFLARPGKFHEVFLPHLVQGKFASLRSQSTLLMENRGAETSTAEVSFLRQDGSVLPDSLKIKLAPAEVRETPVVLSEPFVGWARIGVTGGNTRILLRLSILENGELRSETILSGSQTFSEAFWTGAASSSQLLDTGLAVANPYAVPITVEIELLGVGLRSLERQRLSLPASGQRAILFSELFQTRDGSPRLLRLRSPFPVPARVLRSDGQRLSSHTLIGNN